MATFIGVILGNLISLQFQGISGARWQALLKQVHIATTAQLWQRAPPAVRPATCSLLDLWSWGGEGTPLLTQPLCLPPLRCRAQQCPITEGFLGWLLESKFLHCLDSCEVRPQMLVNRAAIMAYHDQLWRAGIKASGQQMKLAWLQTARRGVPAAGGRR